MSLAHNLPPKVLERIAGYTLSLPSSEDCIGKHPWAFSQVCHSWRAVALGMHWVWAYISLPRLDWQWADAGCASATAAVRAYLQRSGEHPLTVKTVNTRAKDTAQDVWDALAPHVHRIRELALMSSGEDLPEAFRCPLPALRELLVECAYALSIDAPNLCVLEINAMYMSNVDLPWENLRALQFCDMVILVPDFHVLRNCARLEVLSLSVEHFSMADAQPGDPVHLRYLHTLIIGEAAIEVCPYLRTPALQDFTLSIQSNDVYTGWHERMGLLESVTHMTLRDMRCIYGYDINLLRALVKIPKQLRKLTIVDASGLYPEPPCATNQGLLDALIFDETAPSLTSLTEMDFVNGIEGIEWTDDDVSLVRRVVESRASSGSDVCAPLERFSIWTPFADFPASALFEGWAKVKGNDGNCILNVDIGRQGTQVQVEPGSDFRFAVQFIA
ncbi:uncharacterized protein SCHCODRAFT_02359403 [Schizophyllum commune H4-8]|nr:uncharacterized protein SCHCODRAFT_02359403 [Schizophyllum commune H4-8]KAI5889096.1 hypothetical protein SCHCODRAFT_02359403 [Schizophyllum commune H4-8]